MKIAVYFYEKKKYPLSFLHKYYGGLFIQNTGIRWSMCLTYVVTEVQAAIDFRGHEEAYSEPGGVMDYEEDRSRPKR